MRIEIAGQGDEKVVSLRLAKSGTGRVALRDEESDIILLNITSAGIEPIGCARATALPTDSRGRVKVVGYTPDEEVKQWVPVTGLDEVPKDQGPVLVTVENRLVWLIGYHHPCREWRDHVVSSSGAPFTSKHVTAYGIVKPYGGE